MNSVFAFLLTVLLALPATAQAQTWRYDHNGSDMQVVQQGRRVTITYLAPRAGLQAQGVTPGTLLFDGQMDANGYLDGLSRIFRRGCGDLEYFVYGDFRGGQDFRLTGAAPILAPTGCRVIDNSHDVANANLLFTPLGQRPAQPIRAGGSFCVGNLGLSGALNLRTGPGTGYAVLGQIPAGVCQVQAAAPAQGGWQPVRLGDQRGWVAQRYLVRAD